MAKKKKDDPEILGTKPDVSHISEVGKWPEENAPIDYDSIANDIRAEIGDRIDPSNEQAIAILPFPQGTQLPIDFLTGDHPTHLVIINRTQVDSDVLDQIVFDLSKPAAPDVAIICAVAHPSVTVQRLGL